MISRRKFIKISMCASMSFLLLQAASGCTKSRSVSRLNANLEGLCNPKIESGKKIFKDWQYFAVTTNKGDCLLKFVKPEEQIKDFVCPQVQLSITNALECWDKVEVTAELAQSGQKLGIFDIKNAFNFQPFRIEIAPEKLEEIFAQGIRLSITKFRPRKNRNDKREPTARMYFFNQNQDEFDISAFCPHLLFYDKNYDAQKAFEENLLTLNNIQPFGWMEGCQTEALSEMAEYGVPEADTLLEKHLELFLDDEKGAVFETCFSQTLQDGSFQSCEDFLPFAAISRKYPSHIAVMQAVNWITEVHGREQTFYSTEGCYTMAYPILEIAAARGDSKLAQFGVNELLKRIKYLVGKDGAIHQKVNLPKPPTYRNWSRGVAWYMLGLSYSLAAIEKGEFGYLDGVIQIRRALKDAADYITQYQKDSFWYCFMDSPDTGFECSGSMGIAAALAFSARKGFIEPKYFKSAQRAIERFYTHENITPDGLVQNITQSNRLGEDFQRQGYRVIMQLGAGLAILAIENATFLNKRI